MPRRQMPEKQATNQLAGFTRQTQRKLKAMRVIAYALASLFMVVMALRGVWITHDQMEAEADRSVQAAAVSLETMNADATSAAPLLNALSTAVVQLRLDDVAADMFVPDRE